MSGHAIILLLAPIMMFVLTVYSYCLLCFDNVHQFRNVNVYLRNGRGTARPGTRETPASLMACKKRNWNRTFIIQIKCNIKYNAKQLIDKIHNLNSSV